MHAGARAFPIFRVVDDWKITNAKAVGRPRGLFQPTNLLTSFREHSLREAPHLH
jgi:hypothetical protein